ncbi:hypothetical protein TCAL_00174 [Tigriopus californicus]|uniref:Luciferin 4-monooxygenase n=1 Tax=Tigriopus californicus TaxID=6832 RepID=A0A553P2N5_TIGCA|nr:uncharacterized protein LOC131883286 [Tigriopus californicus]TRY71910.1 hypothetical protein TCAL_00174 [Tigriopus californicus]
MLITTKIAFKHGRTYHKVLGPWLRHVQLSQRCLSISGFNRGIIKSSYDDVPISQKNLFHFMWENHSKYYNKIALVDGVTDEQLNYDEAYRKSKNFALRLQSLEALKGDVLAVLLPNCLEYPLVFAGGCGVGVTITTLNPIYTPHEICKQLEMSKACWAVTTKALLPTLEAAFVKLGPVDFQWKERVFIVGEKVPGYHSVTEMLETDMVGEPDVDVNVHEDICVLPYSSGTTGVPKGVMLTHHNIVGNACQQVLGHKDISTITPLKDNESQHVTICVLPMYHVYAMNVTMIPMLYCGGKLVVLPKFEPKVFIEALEKYKPTFLHLAPPLVSFCTTHPDIKPHHLEALEHVVVAAAPSGPALIKKFKNLAPSKVVYREAWGMTETSPIVSMTSLTDEMNGFCGKLVPNTMAKVIDLNTGEPLGPHQRGELCAKGPQIMKGYLDNPEATHSTIKDGWMHSGDIAIYDEQGRISIVDRLKELIKVKGFQVPPAELEDLIRGHEKVFDVAVIGVPHEKFGEAPRAYVVANPGHELTEEEVFGYVKDNAAAYKQLSGGIQFMDHIPRSAAGKILRKDLLTAYLNEQQQ